MRFCTLALSFLLLAAAESLPAEAAHAQRIPAAVAQLMRPDFMRSRSMVPNQFERAKNMLLDDRGIEAFIDPRIVGRDRKIAHGIMASMLPNLRGDFLYYEPTGHVITNNAALLPYASIEFRKYPTSSVRTRKPTATFSRLSPFGMQRAAVTTDSSTSCGPPDPPSSPMGAYTRLVSPCGFATGWGFVYIPQGDSFMASSSDTGNAYFEVQGPGGNAMEGGLSYYSDSSIAPYLRVTSVGGNGYVTMTNNSTRYFAGEILGVFHGITPNPSSTSIPANSTYPNGTSYSGNLAYTIVGALSGSQNPEEDWISSQAVDLINPSYLFYTASPDMVGDGVDLAGVLTPCSGCSVSKVTSIAQNGVPTYNTDNSYFGVDDGGTDAIQWEQVAFGEWTSACAPGASVCPFDSSADPNVYYGLQESYPNNFISTTAIAPTGYGPYESYDSIDLVTGGGSQLRGAAGAFTEPLPPMPCSADSDGNCAIEQSSTPTSQCNTGIAGPRGEPIIATAYTNRYSVYHGSSSAHYLETAYETQKYTAGTGTIKCVLSTTWSPNNPSVEYSDPSLP